MFLEITSLTPNPVIGESLGSASLKDVFAIQPERAVSLLEQSLTLCRPPNHLRSTNTMVFVKVEDVERYWNEVKALGLLAKYSTERLASIHTEYWGREYFLHDPSGNLWHFGEFVS